MADGEHRSSNGQAIRRGDAPEPGDLESRVTALYEVHRDSIYRFLVAQGLNSMVAQEITQDVFVNLFVSLKKETQINSEQAWLYAVAGRAAVDHWRREHGALWVELDSDANSAANVPSNGPDPEATARRKQQLSRVAAVIRTLPKEHRLCIQLRMKGLRYREIAKILGVSISTVAEWLLSTIDRMRTEAND